MAFVKLDCGILDSSLWSDRDSKDIFLAALCAAKPHVIDDPTPSLEVDSLGESGFNVPPGCYGFVETSGTGLVRRACIDPKPGLEALKRLSEPDPDSRTPDHEGRRLVRIAGGWIVLNYDRYREKDHTAAKRMKEYRERQKEEKELLRNVTRNVTAKPRNVTHADADADAECNTPPISSSGPEPIEQPREPSQATAEAEESAKGSDPGIVERKRAALARVVALSDDPKRESWWRKTLNRMEATPGGLEALEGAISRAEARKEPREGGAKARTAEILAEVREHLGEHGKALPAMPEGGEEPTEAPPPAERFHAAWNTLADATGLRPCRKMGQRRMAAFRARWRDQDWRFHYQEALDRLHGVKWIRGANTRNWVADIDWFLRPETVNKILEGGYDDQGNTDEPLYTPDPNWKPF